ncbi:ubiquinol-cytochrome-c reductase complex subunit-domain-containing protein [Cadophora sp. MPI-SDFR-AT-0126]|nr:ubiquinol-cytochrome-c reductase complex subunit-domain-containing protein [Leotiomycetes sp. MPI-SDFR-AT-0126]
MAGEFHPSTGITPPKQNPGYATYRSPYGPKYNTQRNFHGWTLKHATRLGMTLGAFGGVAGVFAVFFFAEVPKVRNDIMVKVPIIGQHFVKEIPASDNLHASQLVIHYEVTRV